MHFGDIGVRVFQWAFGRLDMGQDDAFRFTLRFNESTELMIQY